MTSQVDLGVISVELDFPKIVKARKAAGVTALAAGDDIAIFRLSKGTVIIASYLNVMTAAGAGLTIDIGPTADPDALFDGSNGNAEAVLLSSTQNAYSADTNITFKVVNDPGDLVCRVGLVVVNTDKRRLNTIDQQAAVGLKT